MYLDGPLKDYLQDLAAKKPAPGGGSAAALAAAAAASLISMVANYTIGNPKYKASSEKASLILMKSETARKILESLVDKDVEAYNYLSSCLKGKGNDPVKMEEAYKDAINPPLDVCLISAECLKLCDELVGGCNTNLVSDIAIAAILLEGAFFSAKINVYINMKNIKDIDFIGQIHGKLAALEDRMPKLKEEILEKCEDVISK